MGRKSKTPSTRMENALPSKGRGAHYQLQGLQAEKARLSLKQFVIQAWPILEPGSTFVDGIHIEAICMHLEALTHGRIQNLIINVPPGHAKSLLTAVFWPAWVWIDHPDVRWLFSSHREALATRDSTRCRRLIESNWYQERWGGRYRLLEDQNQKDRFENDRTGYRVVVPMSGGTGERGDIVVVDDPHSVEQAESDAARTSANEWWNGTMSTRLNDLSTGKKVGIQAAPPRGGPDGGSVAPWRIRASLLACGVRSGPSEPHLDRVGGSPHRSGRIALAATNRQRHGGGHQENTRKLPVCGAVPAAAGAGSRRHDPEALVSLLAVAGG